MKIECNYTGVQTYWQKLLMPETSFAHSVVLDPKTSFGGDGVGPNNCIKDGPFKDYIDSLRLSTRSETTASIMR